jgi:hypothetical protein
VPFGSAAFFLPISLRRVLWGISQNRPNGRKTRRKDEQEKVINRLRVVNSLVEEKGREKETFPLKPL